MGLGPNVPFLSEHSIVQLVVKCKVLVLERSLPTWLCVRSHATYVLQPYLSVIIRIPYVGLHVMLKAPL